MREHSHTNRVDILSFPGFSFWENFECAIWKVELQMQLSLSVCFCFRRFLVLDGPNGIPDVFFPSDSLWCGIMDKRPSAKWDGLHCTCADPGLDLTDSCPVQDWNTEPDFYGVRWRGLGWSCQASGCIDGLSRSVWLFGWNDMQCTMHCKLQMQDKKEMKILWLGQL